MRTEIVEGARNLRAILASDSRPAALAGLNPSHEELMLRQANDLLDADLEIRGLEERLRHTVDYSVSLKVANELIAELQAQLLKQAEEAATEVKRLASIPVAQASVPQAFTPLAAALRKAKPKKAKR